METKKVLVLDGSIYTDIYKPTEHWQALLSEVPSHRVHLPSSEPVPDIAEFSHVIVTGSEASIVKEEPWYRVEAEAVRQAFNLGKPMLGSCFGHQMLMSTITGHEHVGSSPTPELGWTSLDVIEEDELLSDIESPFNVFVSHFDEVVDPPRPWRVLASNGECRVHVMRYGDRPIWGIQSHPEINPDNGRTLLKGLAQKLPDKAPLFNEVMKQEPKDDLTAQSIVDRFLLASQ